MSTFASEVLGVLALPAFGVLACIGWGLGTRAAERWLR